MATVEVQENGNMTYRIVTPDNEYVVKRLNRGSGFGLWYEGDERDDNLVVIRESTFAEIMGQAMVTAFH